MNHQTSTLRVLDAAINRASEGLRVVEDFARFVLDDPQLTKVTKRLRHDFASAIAPLSPSARLACRDTEADVGTRIDAPRESQRADSSDVCAASIQRVEQALRSIEEFGKLVDPAAAHQVEQLRYRVYTLERCIGLQRRSRETLASTRIMVLIDGRDSLKAFDRLVESLVDAQVDAIQLRENRRTDRESVVLAKRLVEATRGSKTLAIVNDRPDIAAIARADGVHIGQDDVSVKDARAIVGPNALVGVSTHSLDQVAAAVRDGANYLGVGPVFESDTKSFGAFPGLAFVCETASATRLPWFAIGGINERNLSSVLEAGASRIAVQSAVCSASEPAAVARALASRVAEPRESK